MGARVLKDKLIWNIVSYRWPVHSLTCKIFETADTQKHNISAPCDQLSKPKSSSPPRFSLIKLWKANVTRLRLFSLYQYSRLVLSSVSPPGMHHSMSVSGLVSRLYPFSVGWLCYVRCNPPTHTPLQARRHQSIYLFEVWVKWIWLWI